MEISKILADCVSLETLEAAKDALWTLRQEFEKNSGYNSMLSLWADIHTAAGTLTGQKALEAQDE
jgi:hypothetical protein